MAAITQDNRGLRLAMRYVVLTLIAIIFIFPLLFMVVSSFKPDLQLLRDTSSARAFLPVGDVSFDNYSAAFQRAPVALFVFNTLIVPFETIAIPLLLLVSQLPWVGLEGFEIGWLNSYHVQIVPWIADGLTIFLFVQFFKDLPLDLIEASRVEGASWWQIYRRVVMPLAGPVIATAAILKFLVMYNQYLWPLIVVQEETYRPVMVGLQYFFQLNPAWGEIMAYLTVITVPVLAFYLVLQRSFIASIASTGVKG
jgi:multiple sugar transport system permease protein